MVIYSTFLLKILSFNNDAVVGIAFFPFIIIRKDLKKMPDLIFTLNHERIHLRQQMELLLVPFHIWYVLYYLIARKRGKKKSEAYKSIPFEREAYEHMYDLNYLKERKFMAFFKYVMQ